MANHTGEDRLDQILHDLAPRMESARRAYWRPRVAALLVVPMVVAAAAALAADPGRSAAVTSMAASSIDEPAPGPGVTASSPDEAPVAATASADDKEARADGAHDAEVRHERVELGPLGWMQVRTDGTSVEVVKVQPAPGWRYEVVGATSGPAAVHLWRDGVVYLARLDLDGGRVVLSLTTLDGPRPAGASGTIAMPGPPKPAEPVATMPATPKPAEPAATPKPANPPKPVAPPGPAVVTEPTTPVGAGSSQMEVAVADVARVLITRDGWTVTLIVLWHEHGVEPVVVTSQGDKVHAYFVVGHNKYHVKGWPGDAGTVSTKQWVDAVPGPKTYDGVVQTDWGSFGVSVQNAELHVTWVTPAIDCTHQVMLTGDDRAKVGFSCPDGTYYVKVRDAGGQLGWDVYQ